MRLRRRGQLDLAAFGQGAPARNQAADQLADAGQQLATVVGDVAFALAHQPCDQRIAPPLRLAAPGEVIPGHQVGKILGGKITTGAFALRREHLVKLVQALVLGEGRQHGGVVAAKAGSQQQIPFGFEMAPRSGVASMRSRGSRKRPLANCCAVILDLVEQHRHEVHHAPDLRMALQVRRHVGVILHGMQVHPGQHELACLPAKRAPCRRGRGSPAGACARERRGRAFSFPGPVSECDAPAGRAFPA
jgi:hypothetical protein